jgi:hypothetical protein
MLSGAVSSKGVALWEGQLGNARLVHVEPQDRVISMLRTRNRCGLRGLGGEVSPQERELWSFSAYYPSDPNMRDGAGIAPTANAVYRSAGGPGAAIVLSAPPGTLQGGLGHIDGLGMGFLKKIGKAIGGAVKGVAKVVTKIPGVGLAAGLIPGGAMALSAVKGIAKIGGKASIAGAAGGMLSNLAKCMPEPVSRADFFDLKAALNFNAGICKHTDLVALQKLIEAKCISRQEAEKLAFDAVATEQQKNRVRSDATARAHLAAMANLRAAQKTAIDKLAVKKACACDSKKKTSNKAADRIAARTAKARAKASAKASGKASAKVSALPAGSKQVFDPKLNAYVVYAPAPAKKKKRATITGRGAMHGRMGLFKPTLSLTLGNVLGAFGLATAAQAQSAVAAVTALTKKAGQAPQVKIPQVLAFQKADGKLSADGVWGPNARAAAAWYLGKKVDSMPPVAKPYAKGKVTWQAPAGKPPAAAAKAVKVKRVAKPKPAPVLVSVLPSAPKLLPPPAPSELAPALAPVVMEREPPPAPYAPEAPPAPSSDTYAPAPSVAMDEARSVPIAIAPPGMMVAAISKTDPGLPGGVKGGKHRQKRASRSKPGGGKFAQDPKVSFDVYGPTVRQVSDTSPLVWLAIGWALLHHHRRSHHAA